MTSLRTFLHHPGLERLKSFTGTIRVIVTAALLVFLFSRVDPRSLVKVWGDIRVEWAILACAFVVPNLACQYRRLRVGLVRAHPTAGRVAAIRALLMGLAIGAATPGRIGELGQAVFLPPGGRRRAFGVIAVMRLYAFVATVALGLIMWAAMPRLPGLPEKVGRTLAPILFLTVVLAVTMGEYLFRQTGGPWAESITRRLKGAQDIWIGVNTLRPWDRALFAIWSLLLSLVYLTQLTLFMWAFGGEVAWGEGIAAGAVTMGLVALVPIAIGNIGVRESAAIIVWRNLGVPAQVAFNAAFSLFVLNVFLPGLIGLGWNTLTGDERAGDGSPTKVCPSEEARAPGRPSEGLP